MPAIPVELSSAEGMRTLANYLRSSNGVKVRSGIEHEKRVDYFKGSKMVDAIVDAKNKWPKSLPRVQDRAMAVLLGQQLVANGFIHRSEKIPDKKGYLQICKKNVFEESGIFTWIYAGNMLWSNIATGAVVALVIGFTLLPIWPDAAKHMLWYCSVTFLIITLSFCFLRVVLFLSLWLLGFEFWIFPRLFDESLSFQDSFKPIYSFDKGTPGQGYYRIALLLGLGAFAYWATTQPTEFDGFLKAQSDFIDDLYSGNLLADMPQEARDNIDRNKRVPNLEDLLKEMEMEALEEKASAAAAEEQAKRSVEEEGKEDGSTDSDSHTVTTEEETDNILDKAMEMDDGERDSSGSEEM